MDDKKHIDRLFQEKLKDFEVFPDAEVWKNIEEQLVKKKKRRVFPLWLRLGSAAAILLLLTTGAFWVYNSQGDATEMPEINSIITDVDTDEKKGELKDDIPARIRNEENEATQEKNTLKNATATGTSILTKKKTTQMASTSTKEEVLTDVSTKKKPQYTASIATVDAEAKKIDRPVGETEIPNGIQTAEEKLTANSTKEATVNLDEQKDIKEAVAENKEEVALVEEDKLKKGQWSIGSTVAPVYFNTLSQGSPIHSSLAENEKSSITSISYGIKVNYKINEKLSIQSGVNALELAYQTKNVSALITSSNGLSNDTNINTNVQGLEIVTVPNNENLAIQGQELTDSRQNSKLTNFEGDLNQSFSYIEVPMEAKYNLLQKKLGVHIVGGVSTYVLYRKGIAMQDENGSTQLGEASNVNDLNFSGNVGLDVDYNINKKLYINVSPMFKYQFNTFSKNDGGFQPYYLGIYTGLNFRF